MARPGEIVRVLRWAETPQGVSVWIRVRDDVEIQINSWERDGLLPITALPGLADQFDQHPVYIYRDWQAERGRGARMIPYSEWVREHDAEDVRTVQKWLRAPCADAFKAFDQRCIIHVHGLAQHVSEDGAITGTASYAPGDSVFVQEAEFSGSIGHVTLTTTDGARFTLHSQDRGGFLPITPVRGTHRALAVDEATLRFYPQADWIAEMTATGGTLSYADWVNGRHAKNAVASEGWLTTAQIRNLPTDVRVIIRIHHRATIHDEIQGAFRTDCDPGDRVTVVGIDDRNPGDIAVSLMTKDTGLFSIRANDHGGLLPLSILPAVDAPENPAVPDGAAAYQTVESPADAFLWEVAEELGDTGLARDADFQQFCANMHGTVTPAQAAESWERR